MRLIRPRLLWIAAAGAAVLAVVALWYVPRLSPATGTLVVVAAGRTAGTIPASTLMIRPQGGGWVSLGSVSGAVPAAPDVRQLIAVPMAAGGYDAVRVGGATSAVPITVTAGQVEPVLIGIDGGQVLTGGVYAGNDQVNLGLGELSGKFVSVQPFDLVDQSGRQFGPAQIAGRNAVIAAFHTTCHETCPLYTALFLQLAKRVPSNVILIEVTTDPATDSPAVLADYARRVGASWTFATGSSDQVGAFWKQFGVELSGGDAHTSSMALIDSHGYVRLVYRGAPDVGRDVPPALITSLTASGLSELGSGGDGWGAPDVLESLVTIGSAQASNAGGGGRAPAFTLSSTDGKSFSLATGKPAVINFWRSDCPPCQAEMPLLVSDVAAQANTRLLLVNWGEDPGSARAFLARLGIRDPALLDSDLSVGRAYGVTALPTTIFVRSDGTIDRRQVGQLDDRVLLAELSILGSQ